MQKFNLACDKYDHIKIIKYSKKNKYGHRYGYDRKTLTRNTQNVVSSLLPTKEFTKIELN